jgi:DNA-binding NtrC family response regulator
MENSPICRTVLLVDDDPSHLKLYSWIVNKEGYRAVTALVGSSSVDFPRASRADVVVMDYRYSSQLQAPDVAKLVQSTFPGTPIILISELIWLPDDMKGIVDGFVTKGDPESLLSLIRQLCGEPRSV